MAEKKDDGAKKEFDPEQRFRYVGFEVYQGKKIRDLFKSDSEKESWVKRVLEKRKKGGRLREHNQFDVPRVEGFEKIALTITSLILLASLFMPWFSGYTEYEVTAAPKVEEVAVVDTTMADTTMEMLTPVEDSLADTAVAVTGSEEMAETGGADQQQNDGFMKTAKDERGFSSITAVRKKKEIKRDYVSVSAIGALGLLGSDGGKIFSSGFPVVLTAILIIGYMLLCVFSAVLTLYLVYAGGKKDADSKAIQIKKGLRLNWIPLIIWVVGLLVSFAGSAYSFDTSEMIKQLGSSYGPATYLGLLSYGFYISLAAFILNAAKAVEI